MLQNKLTAAMSFSVFMLATQSHAMAEESWTDHITPSGVVEAEISVNDNDDNDTISANIELAVDARVNKWVNVHLQALYEENEASNRDIEESIISLGNIEQSSLSVAAGKMYLPFGLYETHFVSDPLTLELGETSEKAIQISAKQGSLAASLFAYNGVTKEADEEEAINQYGVNFGIAGEAATEYAINYSYVNNIAESGGLQDAIGKVDLAQIVAGFAVSASLTSGSIAIIAEYVAAADNFDVADLAFDGDGATPTSWSVEAAYSFGVSDKKAALIIGRQGTSESVNIGLPESRSLLAFTIEILQQTSVTVEWVHDVDYDILYGGTGDSTNAYTVQLAASF